MSATAQATPITGTTHSIRGPLRYQITTSSPQLEAGTKFSIYTRITNPYDVPVTIRSVTTLLPVEFIDIKPLERAQRKRKTLELISCVQEETAAAEERSWRSFFGRRKPGIEPARLSSQPVSSAAEEDLVSDSDAESLLHLIRSSPDPDTTRANALHQLHEALVQSDGADDCNTELQPGNSIIHVFTLKTNRSIFFPPNVYQSSVRIEYEIDSARNIDVADYQLNIRAPLRAILFGSLIGAFFGFLLKDLTGDHIIESLPGYQHPMQALVSYLLSLITAMMIAGIAVVAFARKKDAQPILSIEDFWGGVFVGFMAGYTGKSFLEKVAGVSPAPKG